MVEGGGVVVRGILRLVVPALFAVSIWAQDVPGAHGAPLSPFDLAQSIDSGTSIEWNLTWTRLGRSEAPPQLLPECGSPAYSPCSTELISVPNPSQVILLVQPDMPRADFYLRFIKKGTGWKFTGYQAAPLKYYPRRHEMMQFANKPFLRVSVQGESGTGLASEIEEWFDLTLPTFDPVFSFPVQGHRDMLPLDISREVRGYATENRTSGAEVIDLSLLVRFSFDGKTLGELNFLGVYERSPGSAKFSLGHATIPNKDFEDMTRMYEGPKIEKLLVYVLPELKKLATSSDTKTREDLRLLLDQSRDTPEKRELKALLHGK